MNLFTARILYMPAKAATLPPVLPLADPAVDVVIVNWNAGDQLRACVDSALTMEPGEIARLVVVDNDSADGSAAFADRRGDVTLIRSASNIGFGRACNLGAAAGSAPYILLLNPDTELTEHSVAAARTFLESAEGAAFGICGVQHRDEAGHVARHCARFPSPMTFVGEMLGLSRVLPRVFPPLHLKAFAHLESRAVDHVMGAFYLIRRSVFERLGGFDPDFFVYLEDLDLSRRAAAIGYPAYYLASTSIFHRGGGTSTQIKTRALFYVLDSRLVYARKHFGFVGFLAILLCTLIIDPVSRSMFYAASNSIGDVGTVFQAHAMLWRSLVDRPGRYLIRLR